MSLTSDRFQAYIKEMIGTGSRIQQLAISYRDSMPNAGFDHPDAGGDEINSMLDTSLRMVGQLHLMVAQAMYVHGEKINAAAEAYVATEGDLVISINQVLQRAVNAVHNPTTWSSVPGAH